MNELQWEYMVIGIFTLLVVLIIIAAGLIGG